MSLAASSMTLALSMPASFLHTVKAALALLTAASTSVAPQACSWQRTRPGTHPSRHDRIRDGNVFNHRTCHIEKKNQCTGIARCDCDHMTGQSLMGLNEEIKFNKSITRCRLIYWFGFGFHIFDVDSATTPEVEWLFDMKGSWGWAPGPGVVKGPTETRGQERAQQGHLHLPNTELWPPGRVSTNEVFSDIAPKQRQHTN